MQKLFLKLYTVVLACIALSITNGKAQSDWSVNPNEYQYSMSFTTKLVIDEKVSKDTSDMIGAFINGECRGVAKPISPFDTTNVDSADRRYVAFLLVYSNNIEGDSVRFSLFDASNEDTTRLFNTVPFTPNARYGTPAEPLKNLLEEDITAYNFFSPNGDGINDEWKIENMGLYNDFSVSVFNHLGKRVFYKGFQYNNDWEGTYNNKKLPDATYYYTLEGPKGDHVYNGTISLSKKRR